MQFLPFIIGVLVLFIILKILSMPMKLIIKFLINALVGGVVLYVLNLFGVGIVINWITALIVGFLRNTRTNNSSNTSVCTTRNLTN